MTAVLVAKLLPPILSCDLIMLEKIKVRPSRKNIWRNGCILNLTEPVKGWGTILID
jgi:hypothetical protein